MGFPRVSDTVLTQESIEFTAYDSVCTGTRDPQGGPAGPRISYTESMRECSISSARKHAGTASDISPSSMKYWLGTPVRMSRRTDPSEGADAWDRARVRPRPRNCTGPVVRPHRNRLGAEFARSSSCCPSRCCGLSPRGRARRPRRDDGAASRKGGSAAGLSNRPISVTARTPRSSSTVTESL